METLLLNIKKTLPAYFTTRLAFMGLLILFLFTVQISAPTTISAPMTTTYISASKPLIWEYMLGLFPINTAKLVNIQYYGEQFSIKTNAETFEDLAPVLHFNIEKEHLDALASLKLFNNMEIIIPPNQYQIGTASWYGKYFQGRPTASTEPYNMYNLTAAHKALPLGTIVKVTNIKNRKSVIVRINDRGPFVGERVIDLSWEAARQLDVVGHGLATVVLEIVE